MTITANIDVHNVPHSINSGYMVLTLDEGRIWFYGLFNDEYRAQAAVDERPEYRFMVEVTD